MINLSSLKGQRIAVMGLGKTGLSSCLSLIAANVDVVAWDDQEHERIQAVSLGIPIADFSVIPLNDFDMMIWSPGIPHHFPQRHPVALRAEAENVPLVSDVDVLCRVQSQADFIGITGTNGKSTTTALVAHILRAFRPTEMGGNIGVPVLDLAPLDAGGTYVIEMSSYQIELTPSFAPRGAILLNITPDHLQRHGGLEGYVSAKSKIFQNTSSATQKPVAVIGIDTNICQDIFKKNQAKNMWTVIPVSTHKKLDDGVYVLDGQLYDARDNMHVFIADLTMMPSLKGQHNHENAACAYALLRYLYNLDPALIINEMKSFSGLQHRQYLVCNINGVSYINDSKATNADAAGKALACFENIYWILGGQPKEGGLNGLETYMNRINHAYVIGEAAPQFAIWLTYNKVPFTQCGTLDMAVEAAHQAAQAAHEGVVLLSPACASWDQFRSFEHRGELFTDKVMKLSEIKT